jgi:N-acetylmuramate 1-kinase
VNVLRPDIHKILVDHFGDPRLRIKWLAGDGSDRKYYRVHLSDPAQTTYVLMLLVGDDAQKLIKGEYEWLDVSNLLFEQKILVPKAIAVFPDKGIIVIEDYGDVTLQDYIAKDLLENGGKNVMPKYSEAIEIIIGLLKITPNPSIPWQARKFDQEKLEWEMRFFFKEFVEKFLIDRMSASDLKRCRDESVEMAAALAQHSRYLVHRDYHSRNIMVSVNSELAVIDFQDARQGSLYYDAASLIYDSYVGLSDQNRSDLIDIFAKNCKSRLDIQFERELFLLTLLQRQLKAIGSFAYLTITKSRGNYMKYVNDASRIITGPCGEMTGFPFLGKTMLAAINECDFSEN